MTFLNYFFVLACAVIGWLAGIALWKIIRGQGSQAAQKHPVAKADTAVERREPPVNKMTPEAEPVVVRSTETDLSPMVDIQQALQEILSLLRDAAGARTTAEDRLLAEMRATISAEDPGLRARLDKIADKLGIDTSKTAEPLDAYEEREEMHGDSLSDWEDDLADEAAVTEADPRERPERDHYDDNPDPDGALSKEPSDADPDQAEADEADTRIVRQISVP